MAREEFDKRLARVEEGRVAAETRLVELLEPEKREPDSVDLDLLAEIRQRLDEGLTDEEHAEIVRLLVKRITVFTNVEDGGKKTQRALVEYRFIYPSPTDTVNPASQNYTICRRTIERPSGRQKQAGP